MNHNLLLYVLKNRARKAHAKQILYQFIGQMSNAYGLIIVFNQSSIKMYGVDQSLMKRIQRRMKEKIYREMLEQEQKAKRNGKQDKSGKQYGESRFKTSPSYNDSEREPNKYQSPHILNESVTFLPIINKRQGFESDGEGERRMNPQNKNRQNLKQKRRNRAQRPSERRFSSANGSFEKEKPFKTLGDDIEQQKTEQYLNQCQQIITNLRELTRKNKEKVNQRENRSGYSNDFSYPPQNKSFRGNDLPTNTNSYTPKNDYSKANSFQLSNPMKSSVFNNNSWESSSRPNSFSFNNDVNKQSSFEFQKQRPNFRRISPPRVRIQDLKQKSAKNPKDKNRYQNSQQEEPEEESGQNSQKQYKVRQSKGKPSKQAQVKPKSNKGRQNIRRLSPIRRQNQEIQKDKQPQQNKEQQQAKPKSNKKDIIEELMKENQRQKAIVKYLKKARLRGNQLKKKVQSRKGNGEEGNPDQNGDQEPNQNDPNDPNSKQNDPNDPNKANNPNDPKANPSGANPNGVNGQVNKLK